jgi:hypothetical protein
MTKIKKSPPRLPKRSHRYGVGKEIGGAIYLHRSYEQLLGEEVLAAKSKLPQDFHYTIVKYQSGRGAVSFIHSPDFDEAPEPVVGASWIVYPDGTAKHYSQAADPFIYHHKWLFVADDYTGFDITESKHRSILWQLLVPPVDTKRIGRKSYWEALVLPRLSVNKG